MKRKTECLIATFDGMPLSPRLLNWSESLWRSLRKGDIGLAEFTDGCKAWGVEFNAELAAFQAAKEKP